MRLPPWLTGRTARTVSPTRPAPPGERSEPALPGPGLDLAAREAAPSAEPLLPGLPDSLAVFHLGRVPAVAPPPPVMTPAEAAAELVGWLRGQGIYGWLATHEITDAWAYLAHRIGAAGIPIERIREHLSAQPGVVRRRCRLTSDPGFADVRRRLRHARLPDDRAFLTYIPDDTEVAALLPREPSAAAETSSGAASGRSDPPGGLAGLGRDQAGAGGSTAGQSGGKARGRHRTISDVRLPLLEMSEAA